MNEDEASASAVAKGMFNGLVDKPSPTNQQPGQGGVSEAAAIELTLPWPDKKLSPNARVHWATKATSTKAARSEAGWAVRRHFHVRPNWTRAAVGLVFCPPDERRRDLQNCIGSSKALVDGIADALGIDDSKFDCSYSFGQPVKGGAVKVTIKSGGD